MTGFAEFFCEATTQHANASTNDTPSTVDTSNIGTGVGPIPDLFEEECSSTEEILLAEV